MFHKTNCNGYKYGIFIMYYHNFTGSLFYFNKDFEVNFCMTVLSCRIISQIFRWNVKQKGLFLKIIHLQWDQNSYPTKSLLCEVFNNFHKPCEIVTTNVFSSFQLCRTISPSSYVLLHFACLLGEARKLYFRESSPYEDFMTANFITAFIQNVPEIFS